MMKEEAKLMKLNFQKETNKQEENQGGGLKNVFFRLFYILITNQTESYFRDIVFIIIQFIQIIAFPMENFFFWMEKLLVWNSRPFFPLFPINLFMGR